MNIVDMFKGCVQLEVILMKRDANWCFGLVFQGQVLFWISLCLFPCECWNIRLSAIHPMVFEWTASKSWILNCLNSSLDVLPWSWTGEPPMKEIWYPVKEKPNWIVHLWMVGQNCAFSGRFIRKMIPELNWTVHKLFELLNWINELIGFIAEKFDSGKFEVFMWSENLVFCSVYFISLESGWIGLHKIIIC